MAMLVEEGRLGDGLSAVLRKNLLAMVGFGLAQFLYIINVTNIDREDWYRNHGCRIWSSQGGGGVFSHVTRHENAGEKGKRVWFSRISDSTHWMRVQLLHYELPKPKENMKELKIGKRSTDCSQHNEYSHSQKTRKKPTTSQEGISEANPSILKWEIRRMLIYFTSFLSRNPTRKKTL